MHFSWGLGFLRGCLALRPAAGGAGAHRRPEPLGPVARAARRLHRLPLLARGRLATTPSARSSRSSRSLAAADGPHRAVRPREPASRGAPTTGCRTTIDFVPLPHYPSLAHPLAALRGMAGSLRRFWRSLDDVDAVWLLGPHLLAIGFAVLAALRGQEGLPRRAPGPAALRREPPPRQALDDVGRKRARGHLQADGPPLPGGRRGPAAGRELPRRRGACWRCPCRSSAEDQIVDPAEAAAKPWENGELRILTVGRLETREEPAAARRRAGAAARARPALPAADLRRGPDGR